MSVVSMAGDTVDDPMIEEVARALGIDIPHARRCIGIALPALLAMLCGRGSTVSGAGAVFDALRDGHGLSALLGEDEAALTMRAVGLRAGIDAGQSADLLDTLLPVALGVIDREVAARELDKTGLSRFLSAQRGNIGDALPAELAESMRGSRHFDAFMAGFVTDAATPMTDTAAPDPAVLAWAEYARTVGKPTAMRIAVVAVLALLAAAWLLYLTGMQQGTPPPIRRSEG